MPEFIDTAFNEEDRRDLAAARPWLKKVAQREALLKNAEMPIGDVWAEFSAIGITVEQIERFLWERRNPGKDYEAD